jgi:flagellar protein FliS
VALNTFPYRLYQENAILSARPPELVLILYNAILRFIRQAREHIVGRNVGAAHQALIRAQDAIRTLDEALDHRYEVAANLTLLYEYIYRRLVEANLKKDATILDEVAGLVEQLRDTWEEAMRLADNPGGNGEGLP